MRAASTSAGDGAALAGCRPPAEKNSSRAAIAGMRKLRLLILRVKSAEPPGSRSLRQVIDSTHDISMGLVFQGYEVRSMRLPCCTGDPRDRSEESPAIRIRELRFRHDVHVRPHRVMPETAELVARHGVVPFSRKAGANLGDK